MWVVWMVAARETRGAREARETRVLGRGLRKRPGGLLGVCWGGARREARETRRERRVGAC